MVTCAFTNGLLNLPESSFVSGNGFAPICYGLSEVPKQFGIFSLPTFLLDLLDFIEFIMIEPDAFDPFD